MTQPKTAIEAWQDAKNAEERVFAEEMARTDNGVLASAFGEKAAAAVLEAWASEREAKWRAFLENLSETVDYGDEIGAKIDPALRTFADGARHLLAGERGE